MERFRKKGLEAKPTARSWTGIIFKERKNLFDTEEFRSGLFEIQDEGSQLICEKLDVKPGEVIWDMCAGGGGKSLALAGLMQNKGRIIATDIRIKKLEDLKKRARRGGVTNIFPADLQRVSEIREVKKRGIDKILIDAPCSGTGTLRRNPDVKWKLTEESLLQHHQEQVKIIEKALPYLRPGGRIYYVTCSLEPLENEEVVNEVLMKHPELVKIPFGSELDGFFRLYPHRDGTDGFFLAQVENKES